MRALSLASVVASPPSFSGRRAVDEAVAGRFIARKAPLLTRSRLEPPRASADESDSDGASDATAPARARRRRVVRRPLDDASAASKSTSPRKRGEALSAEEKRARAEALRLRDVQLRAEPLVLSLLRACENNETRAAQEHKKELWDLVGEENLQAVPARAHEALIAMYCRAKLPALAERAFADALRAGVPPTDTTVWQLIACFESTGDASKAEEALAYLEARSAAAAARAEDASERDRPH
jgi:hypothetical protein